uniref:Uncharacterized protein n=1 Tax=Ananas comosus var. bracteatus TaxID=296719 RepID=A0A6V7PBN9_ANACO|nr:unnamed protein product [Ananas comosus var. bracteatus]
MQQGDGSEAQVTWEDQQNINRFGRLNNRFHELEDEIKLAKATLDSLRTNINLLMALNVSEKGMAIVLIPADTRAGQVVNMLTGSGAGTYPTYSGEGLGYKAGSE